MYRDLIEVDEVGVEDGDVVLGVVADEPELLHDPGLVPAVQDPVALQHEPAPHHLQPRHTTSSLVDKKTNLIQHTVLKEHKTKFRYYSLRRRRSSPAVKASDRHFKHCNSLGFNPIILLTNPH